MITFQTASGAALSVNASNTNFSVFPEKPKAGDRALAHNPTQDWMDKVLSWPGEYDFDGVFIRAIGQDEGRQVSYVCEIDNVRCAFAHAPIQEWADSELEKLGDVDVLIVVPDDAKKLKALVEAVDPRIAILIPSDKVNMKEMAEACGSTEPEEIDKYKVQTSTLPMETRHVVILK